MVRCSTSVLNFRSRLFLEAEQQSAEVEGVQKPWQPSKQTLEARFSVDTLSLATKFGEYHLTLVVSIVSKSCVHWICGLGDMWQFAIGSLRE